MSAKLLGWAKPEQILEGAGILRKACDVLDEQGWIQNEYVDRDGRCCMVGAMRVAKYGLDGPLPTSFSFDEPTTIAYGIFSRVAGIHPPMYNDTQGRTVTDVKAKMIEVAEYAEREVAAWQAKQTPEVSGH